MAGRCTTEKQHGEKRGLTQGTIATLLADSASEVLPLQGL